MICFMPRNLVAYLDDILVQNRGIYEERLPEHPEEDAECLDPQPFQKLKGREDFKKALGYVLSFVPPD